MRARAWAGGPSAPRLSPVRALQSSLAAAYVASRPHHTRLESSPADPSPPPPRPLSRVRCVQTHTATHRAALAAAKLRYDTALAGMGGKELLVSCSDDFTLFLWDPSDGKKPLARMTGHQAPVNHISFSPDGRYVASAGCVARGGRAAQPRRRGNCGPRPPRPGEQQCSCGGPHARLPPPPSCCS